MGISWEYRRRDNIMNIYIVEAWRWGDKEDHSYVVGCWDNLEGAKRAAMTHGSLS